jgi:nucleotide-binding universal stress UspA family protein
MKTILAPIDFSGATNAVVAEAANLAKALGARVVLLTVIQPPVITHEFAAMMDNLGEITAAAERQAARKLETTEHALQVDLVAAESVQLTGAPIPLIVEQARKLDADYIVMGSHGHTALYDLLVGSTTHGVLLRAPCPVVIVPAVRNVPARPAPREEAGAI